MGTKDGDRDGDWERVKMSWDDPIYPSSKKLTRWTATITTWGSSTEHFLQKERRSLQFSVVFIVNYLLKIKVLNKCVS